MAKRQVFYSFHFKNDVMRVQQIRNMGVVEGNTPVAPNTWEEVKRRGDTSIKKWIDENMRYRSCVVVLVGSETANRKWVRYEIENIIFKCPSTLLSNLLGFKSNKYSLLFNLFLITHSCSFL